MFRWINSSAALLLRLSLVTIVLGAVIAGFSGCSKDPNPCLIFIITDTTRYDRLGYAGNPLARSSTLDSLAHAGVNFAQAISHVPVTAPSITTILSGVLPPAHGVRDNGRYIVNTDLELLAEIFQDAGFQTAGVVAAVPLLGRFGYNRGFDFFSDEFSADDYPIYDPRLAGKESDLRRSERRASAVTDRALAWLDGISSRKPVFLLAHYFDPHHPLDPPPSFAAAHPGRPYDGEVAYMDAEIGRLLAGVRAKRGEGADIRVIVVGDHGEGLGQHDEADHGFFLYDSTLHIPLIFCGPGATPGLQVTAPVRTQDIARTTCAWLDVPAPVTADGASLLAALGGGPVPAECDTAYMETFLTQLHYNWSPLIGLRTNNWKYVKGPQPELYDLLADSQEETNLIGGKPDVSSDYIAALDRVVSRENRRFAKLGADLAGADADLDRRLRSLGYAATKGRRVIVPDFELIDPKEGNRRFNRRQAQQVSLFQASQLLKDGKSAQALSEVEKAVAIDPLSGRGAEFHAYLLTLEGHLQEAVLVYQKVLRNESNQVEKAQNRLNLLQVLIQLEDKAAARAHWDTLTAASGLPAEIRAVLPELAGQIDRIAQ